MKSGSLILITFSTGLLAITTIAGAERSLDQVTGAILSIAFNKPYPIVDGNVRRVFCRVKRWSDDDPKILWHAADRLVQQVEPRLINQAIMELGATVCSFKAPRCLVAFFISIGKGTQISGG